MTNENGDGEFRGTTKEAIVTLKQDVSDVKRELQSVSRRTAFIILLLAVLFAERANQFIGLALAGF